jgi:hypothetical protein
MFDLLQRQGYEVNKEVMYLAFPQAEHSEADWATPAAHSVQFLFARYAEDDMVRLRQGRQPAREQLRSLFRAQPTHP